MDDAANQVRQQVASLFDANAAYTLAALLEAEMIPAEVISVSSQRWDVLVPLDVLDRARSILDASAASDAELSYLATGKLEDK